MSDERMTNRVVIVLTILCGVIAFYCKSFQSANSEDLYLQLAKGYFNWQGIGAIALILALSALSFFIKEKLPRYAKAILDILLPLVLLWIAAKIYWHGY